MGIDFGPYFATFIALVRRLFLTRSAEESAPAADGVTVTVRRQPSDDYTETLTCSTPDQQHFTARLIEPGHEALRPPLDLMSAAGEPILIWEDEAASRPQRLAVCFAPENSAELANRMGEESLARGWAEPEAFAFSTEGPVAFALHRNRSTRYILDMPGCGAPTVVVVEMEMPAA